MVERPGVARGRPRDQSLDQPQDRPRDRHAIVPRRVGSDAPLTVMLYSRMREGATPVLNAVSLLPMVALTLLSLMLLRRSARPR